METAFLLGLGSGGACLAGCGPLAAALLAAEERSLKSGSRLLAVFLSGRLLGYLAWALLSWVLGYLLAQTPPGYALLSSAELILGAWLIYYGIRRPAPFDHSCPATALSSRLSSRWRRGAFSRAGIWGFLSGLQICAPFLAASAQAAQTETAGGALLFFLIFYLGTAIWFIPFPVFGMLGRFPQAAQVARFVTVPLGAYFIYSGIISIAGGNLYHG